MKETLQRSRTRVLGREKDRLEAVLEFASFASKPMPLLSLLDEAPHRIAAILRADVCSIYLLEGEGDLVMRGNIGFPRSVLGQIRLGIGEGITGQAVEYMRPVVAELAADHAFYKHFEELDEERFPVFLAVPLRGRSGPAGAAVVQRQATAGSFDAQDVELLVLLGALIAAGVRTAELIDAQRDKTPIRRAGGGTRKVTLTGRPVVPGFALGAIAALRRPPSRPSERVPVKGDAAADARVLRSAFEVAEKAIGGLVTRARKLDIGQSASFLGTYIEILGDARFLGRATELAKRGVGIPQALGQVARDVTRAAVQLTRDPFMEERARDIEDLCDALSMLAASDKRAELPQKAILVGDALTVFDVLVSSRAHPVAVALSERSSGPRTRTLLELLGVPAIVDVQGLFRWSQDGDVALADANHGLFVINPSKGEIAAVRERTRSEK
ncbi:MAG TPA: GAF domain-containing protein [Polyangiaceae bacterium]|nr:GAF domain-containing protein [Polyangiaceae bacterium]